MKYIFYGVVLSGFFLAGCENKTENNATKSMFMIAVN